jgi:hypothetical protein
MQTGGHPGHGRVMGVMLAGFLVEVEEEELGSLLKNIRRGGSYRGKEGGRLRYG